MSKRPADSEEVINMEEPKNTKKRKICEKSLYFKKGENVPNLLLLKPMASVVIEKGATADFKTFSKAKTHINFTDHDQLLVFRGQAETFELGCLGKGAEVVEMLYHG